MMPPLLVTLTCQARADQRERVGIRMWRERPRKIVQNEVILAL